MDELILKHLRDALNNLYEPEHLRANPLAEVFGVAGRGDTPIAMQKALEGLVQSLKPRPGEPGRSQKRRIYDLLHSRYIDQFSQKEVADQLGISLRTYQREQQAALEYLAGLLNEKYPAAGFTAPAPLSPPPTGAPAAPSADDEFSWMFAPSVERSARLEAVVESARQLIQPLAQRYQVELGVDLAHALPRVAIHPEALLQIVLNVLTAAVHRSERGGIEVRAGQVEWQAALQFTGSGMGGPLAAEQDSADQASLEVARKLVEMAGGSFSFLNTTLGFSASVSLPLLESLPVLVIDDSADNIKLIERYLAGTRFQVSSLSDPEQALAVVEQARPQVILLDLMMPGVDGLEVLTRLRTHPAASLVPAVVCTILPQEELALSLGASAFLRKPVRREDLLAVLERLVAPRGPAPG